MSSGAARHATTYTPTSFAFSSVDSHKRYIYYTCTRVRKEDGKVVRKANLHKFDEFHTRLNTGDRGKYIFLRTKIRERGSWDTENVKCIKDDNGQILIKEEDSGRVLLETVERGISYSSCPMFKSSKTFSTGTKNTAPSKEASSAVSKVKSVVMVYLWRLGKSCEKWEFKG